MHPFRACLPAFVLLGAASAQRTWIVDRAGGAGVDFTDLPPALAAATAGDVVVVRANPVPYSTGIASRGITLLGDGVHGSGGFVRLQPGLIVRAVPAAESFAMRNFLGDNTAAPAITIDACAGAVHLNAITVQAGFVNPGMVITQSAAVTLLACSLGGAPALHVAGSRVAASGCDARGRPLGVMAPGPACTVDAAILDISEGTWVGGGATFSPPTPSAPALVAFNSSALTVTGGLGLTFVSAGVSPVPPAGIDLSFSTLDIDPAVITGGVSGTGTVTTTRLPSLAVNVSRGAPIVAQVRSQIGDVLVLVVGLPGLPLSLPPLGGLWLDPLAVLVVAVGMQTSGVTGFVPASLPLDVPVGIRLGFQALSGTGQSFRLSNAVVTVVP